jgi:hypothetical protein
MRTIFFLFFIFPILTFGQIKEVSIGLHRFHYRSTSTDTINGYKSKGNYLSTLNNGIGFTYFVRPTKFIEASIGYAPLHSQLRYTRNIIENGLPYLRVNTTNETNYSTYGFVGYGISNSLGKVQWRVACRLSVQHLKKGAFTRNEEVFDAAGNIVSFRRNTETNGYNVNIGAFMTNSFVLPIYKRFALAADFSVGYVNENYYGTYLKVFDLQTLSGNVSNITEKRDYKKNANTYFYYYPSISIRYAFGK